MSGWSPAKPEVPASFYSCDLLWWRESDRHETLVSSLGGQSVRQLGESSQEVLALWFDGQGTPLCAASTQLDAREPLFVDGRVRCLAAGDARAPGEGVLALFASMPADVRPERGKTPTHRNRRSLPCVIDWVSEGAVTTLHSDQVVHRGFPGTELTEVLVDPADGPAALIFLNGPAAQAPGAIRVDLRDVRGRVVATLASAAASPWTVMRLELGSSEALASLSGGEPLLVTGDVSAVDMFQRPYVLQEGSRCAAYHGGDRYADARPQLGADWVARGYCNPVVVWHGHGVETLVSVFHSHGSLDHDAWIGLRIYDDDGALVLDDERWARTRRGGAVRRSLRSALASHSVLRGHASFYFSGLQLDTQVPPILQVLSEYRKADSVGRAMLWSDDWNSPLRRRSLGDARLHSWMRVWCGSDLHTTTAIANPGWYGVSGAYDLSATYTFTLINDRGERWVGREQLDPHATRFVDTDKLFPDVRDFLAPHGVGMLLVEADRDLAMVQFTEHVATGNVSVEHLMSLRTMHLGHVVAPAGS